MPDIYEDTRQKVGKHESKHRWFESHGVVIERRALATGDYERADGLSNVLVDTKSGIDELAMDVGREHARFVRELERAREAGCRLVVLVECGNPYRELDDVAKWYPQPCRRCQRRGVTCEPRSGGRCRKFKRKPMQGPTLLSILRTLENKYKCRFELCHPFRVALRICELLGVKYE